MVEEAQLRIQLFISQDNNVRATKDHCEKLQFKLQLQ